jgi:hypothetical protein
MTAARKQHLSNEELSIRINRLELTLEYIASIADAYCSDDFLGKKFTAIRNTAQEMINEHRQVDQLRVEESELLIAPLFNIKPMV